MGEGIRRVFEPCFMDVERQRGDGEGERGDKGENRRNREYDEFSLGKETARAGLGEEGKCCNTLSEGVRIEDL